MNSKTRFSCESAELIGLLINSLSINLLVKSNFGVSVISSVPLVLNKINASISFGAWNVICQVIAILILIVVTRRAHIGYAASFIMAFLFGFLIDIVKVLIIGWPVTFLFQSIYFIVGFSGLAVGISMFIKCRLPVLPFDSFVRDLCLTFNWPIKLVKTAFDATCFSITIFLSYLYFGKLTTVGIGTVISVLFMGTLVHEICLKLEQRFDFEPIFTFSGKIIETIKIN